MLSSRSDKQQQTEIEQAKKKLGQHAIAILSFSRLPHSYVSTCVRRLTVLTMILYLEADSAIY